MNIEAMERQLLDAIQREQKRLGWPHYVPAWAEVPEADGEIRLHNHHDLNAGQCEQLVEHHSRKANRALTRWVRSGSSRSLRTAAWNIIRARLYRCQTFILTGR